jgi:hypothetical protein
VPLYRRFGAADRSGSARPKIIVALWGCPPLG